MQLKTSYVHYFSVLKVLAMISVVCIHTFAAITGKYCTILSKFEVGFGEFIFQVLQAWAVPVFTMVSGALFLDKNRDIPLEKFYKKYILRLVLILLSFGTLYALMELVFTAHSINFKIILLAFRNVYSGKLWNHMWFLYMIIGLYIVTPFLKKFLESASSKDVIYTLIILLIFSCIEPLINEITGIKFGVYIPFNTIDLFFYLLGYSIHNEIIKIKDIFSIVMIIAGILWCLIGQFIPGMLDIYVDGNMSLKYSWFFGVFMAIGIFSLAKSKCNVEVNWIDTKIVPLSLGVYVIHPLFINIFYKVLHFTPDYYNVWFCWIFVLLVTLASSLLAIWLLRKIPLVRKWIL